ncbi:hypothetical protein PUR71_06640 [Streptomyces sp. SP17BM10]|uniref:hypothetical protein n=1 Tax=Streptomyces sp. SP17BM10 TaxID=3002530 RepID=UPI002E7A64C5|nr:hypothetical protein [Streptomyces sp. SP17BM10]MEE1782599.1 hypothetical protein [Streptomyces sp. SP17BM10]
MEPAEQRGEHWWPVASAVLVAALLHVALPPSYRESPPWVLPVVMVVLLAVLIGADPGRIDQQARWLRMVTDLVIAFITLANLFAAASLVADILTDSKLYAGNATGLLATGGVVWVTIVIAFALWATAGHSPTWKANWQTAQPSS